MNELHTCKICGKEFETAKSRDGHMTAHVKRYGKTTRKRTGKNKKHYSDDKIFSCRHCSINFNTHHKRNGHEVWCKLNPKYNETVAKNTKKSTGRKHSQKTKEHLSKIANERIKAGTWHNSFSRARTHIYKGINLYGMWEVKYAIYLDAQNIIWERPKNTFPYKFENVTKQYTPDFYIPSSDSYVEIKGYTTAKDRAKWAQFPLKLTILTGESLVEMKILEEKEIRRIKQK